MPKMRSDGARSTGRAIAIVTIAAAAVTPNRSTAWLRKSLYCGKDEDRTSDRPAADVAHVRRQPSVCRQRGQREQPRRLRQAEHGEPCEYALPRNRGERRR